MRKFIDNASTGLRFLFLAFLLFSFANLVIGDPVGDLFEAEATPVKMSMKA